MNRMYVSVLLGLIVGWMIMYWWIRRPKIHGPNSNIIREQIYRDNDKCYKYTPMPYVCSTRSKKEDII